MGAAIALLLATLPLAHADHWGSPGWHENINAQCEPDTYRSECTPQEGSNYYYFDAAFDSGILLQVQNQLKSTLYTHYDPLDGIVGFAVSELADYVDVRVREATILPQKPYWMYVTCAPNAIISDGNGRYQSCRKLLIRVDKNHDSFDPCVRNDSTGFCLDWFACHELGHTYGLHHPGDYPNENVSWTTCMDYHQDTSNLHPYDEDHLLDCFPKANPAARFSYFRLQ